MHIYESGVLRLLSRYLVDISKRHITLKSFDLLLAEAKQFPSSHSLARLERLMMMHQRSWRLITSAGSLTKMGRGLEEERGPAVSTNYYTAARGRVVVVLVNHLLPETAKQQQDHTVVKSEKVFDFS